jgi:hypothetical protein
MCSVWNCKLHYSLTVLPLQGGGFETRGLCSAGHHVESEDVTVCPERTKSHLATPENLAALESRLDSDVAESHKTARPEK